MVHLCDSMYVCSILLVVLSSLSFQYLAVFGTKICFSKCIVKWICISWKQCSGMCFSHSSSIFSLILGKYQIYLFILLIYVKCWYQTLHKTFEMVKRGTEVLIIRAPKVQDCYSVTNFINVKIFTNELISDRVSPHSDVSSLSQTASSVAFWNISFDLGGRHLTRL